MQECIRRYFLQGNIFCLSIHMSVSKPSICFWKLVISIKWRNKLLIHKINLTGHRKTACWLQLLLFLEIWVIAPFWHWRSQDLPKGCCHHDLKAFCETGYNSVVLNITEIWSKHESYIIKVCYLTILLKGLEEREGEIKNRKSSFTWFLVTAADLFQTFLGQTQTKPYWSRFS